MAKIRLKPIVRSDNINISVKSKNIEKAKKSTIKNKYEENNDAKNAGIKLRRCVVKVTANKKAEADVALQAQRAVTISHSANTKKTKLQKCVVRLKCLPTIDSSHKLKCHNGTIEESRQLNIDESVIDVPRIASLSNHFEITQKPQNVETIDKPKACVDPLKTRNFNIRLRRTPILETSQISAKTVFDITSFEPIRNSTICQMPERIGRRNEPESHFRTILSDAKPKEGDPVNEKSSQNLANKSDLIKEILLSDDQVPKNVGRIAEQPKASEKAQKFFFRKKTKEMEANCGILKAGKAPMKRKSTKTRNVYDFLSLSQNSDSEKHEDPAADIVKKMINEGRVAVATHKKGCGKPKIKQQRKVRKVRPIGKRRQCSLDDITKQFESATHDQIVAAADPIPERLSPVYEPEFDKESDVFNTEEVIDPSLLQNHSVQFATKANDSKKQNNSTEGSISKLARSVLINQTKSSHKTDLANRRRLLDVARKFVSTPVNMKTTTATTNTGALHTTNLSPIFVPSRQQSGGQSPWRVPDEAPLPNTFFFGRNTSNLPSFSSDYIQRTPQKQNKNSSKHQTVLNNQTVVQLSNNVGNRSLIENPSLWPDEAPSALRSPYESNDSNCENVAPSPFSSINSGLVNKTPSKLNANKEPSDDQENENHIHLPNPRRALQYRSPLKPINILEVITLPSWKNNTTPAKEKQIPVRASSTASVPNKGQKTPSKEQYFGFEDFLNNSTAIESDVDDVVDPCTSANAVKTASNKTLHEKMQNLREIRPADEELPRPALMPKSRLYDDLDTRRQRNIRDMLCSTMINNKTHQTEGDDTRDLFKDPDPETTFDNQKPHQTYVRSNKRKRKQRHQFVMFMDSDLSEEEEDELNTSPKNRKVQKHKKKCTLKEGAQLKEFMTSFNAMCKEVEQFEIPVE